MKTLPTTVPSVLFPLTKTLTSGFLKIRRSRQPFPSRVGKRYVASQRPRHPGEVYRSIPPDRCRSPFDAGKGPHRARKTPREPPRHCGRAQSTCALRSRDQRSSRYPTFAGKLDTISQQARETDPATACPKKYPLDGGWKAATLFPNHVAKVGLSSWQVRKAHLAGSGYGLCSLTGAPLRALMLSTSTNTEKPIAK